MSVCAQPCVNVCLSVCIYVFMCIYYVHMEMYIYMNMHMPIYIYICSVCLHSTKTMLLHPVLLHQIRDNGSDSVKPCPPQPPPGPPAAGIPTAHESPAGPPPTADRGAGRSWSAGDPRGLAPGQSGAGWPRRWRTPGAAQRWQRRRWRLGLGQQAPDGGSTHLARRNTAHMSPLSKSIQSIKAIRV